MKEAKVGKIDKVVTGEIAGRMLQLRSLRLPGGSRVLTFLVGILAGPDLLSGKIFTEEEVELWKSG